MNPNVIIIGGGMGGLFTGALLAKEGLRVQVIEKNPSIGGGLQNFVRQGECYETGMHIATGFEEGGPLDRICRHLGISDRLHLCPCDRTAVIEVLEDHARYDLPSGRKAFADCLRQHFPQESDGIDAYMAAVARLYEEEPLLQMKPVPQGMPGHSAEFMMPADAFIARYVTDNRLRSLLAFINPLYAGIPGHSPAYLQAIISHLFIERSYRFEEGSACLAEALAEVIELAGGEVLRGEEVCGIDVEGKEICAVHTSKGRTFRADTYISDIAPRRLLELLPETALPKAYRSRLQDIPQTVSAFKVFIKLKPEAFPYANHPVYLLNKYEDVWRQSQYDANAWPCGLSCFAKSDAQGQWATHLTLLTQMSFEEVRQWEHTRTGRRGAGYESWKAARMEQVIDLLAQAYPEIRSQMESCFAASPLSFRDWYGSWEGSLYGYRKDCENPVLSQLSIRTRLGNLLLTGQNVNMHGIGGVPMTAIETAETLLGKDVVVNRLKQL